MKYILLAKAVINKVLDKAVGPLEMAILGIVVISTLSYALAWQAPGGNPPVGNTDSPLNTGSTGQAKSGGLILNTGGAATGLIVQNGNVGIGTTGPENRLTIKQESGNTAQLKLEQYNGQDGWKLNANFTTGNLDFIRDTASGDTSPIVSMTMGGNVGIGTAGPTARLHLGSTAATTPAYSFTNNGEGFLFNYGDNAGARFADIVAIGNTPAGATMDLRFWTNSGAGVGTATEKMRITGGGNVGIGTTTPQAKLDVNGGIIVKNTTVAVPGTIKFDGVDFFGYTSSGWKSLTATTTTTTTSTTILDLINGRHGSEQCTTLGGSVATDGENKMCRFSKSFCPSDWTHYKNWSTTISTVGSYQNATCQLVGFSEFSCGLSSPVTCSVAGHSWSNNSIESTTCSGTPIAYGNAGSGFLNDFRCGGDLNQQMGSCPGTNTTFNATITEFGCY